MNWLKIELEAKLMVIETIVALVTIFVGYIVAEVVALITMN